MVDSGGLLLHACMLHQPLHEATGRERCAPGHPVIWTWIDQTQAVFCIIAYFSQAPAVPAL